MLNDLPFTHKEYSRYFNQLLNFSKPSYLFELISVVAPMGMMYCVEVGFFFALTLVMGTFGRALLAANQIAMQYLGTLMSVLFSIAQAVTVRMGHLLGEGDEISAESVGYVGVSISVTLMLGIIFIYWFFPASLISIDFDIHNPINKDILHFGIQFLAVAAIFQIFESARISLFGALRALKDTRFTLFISIISFWCLALPIGYLLATKVSLGGIGLWWGMALGAGFSVLLLLWRFQTKVRYYKKGE